MPVTCDVIPKFPFLTKFDALTLFLEKKLFYNNSSLIQSSEPFISGDTYKFFCEQTPDFLFVEADDLAHWVKAELPKLKTPITLVTANGDLNVDESWIWLTEHPMIKYWWAQNCHIYHPKIGVLPIGLEGLRKYHHGVTADFLKLRKKPQDKKIMKILFGFATGNNPSERIPLEQILKSTPLADSLVRINPRSYRKILKTYAFVASPPGKGWDCHRTWEALYLGTIPIVKKSFITDQFSNFPWWVVEDWKELQGLSSEILDLKYAEISKRGWDHPELWWPYWQAHMLNQKAKE